jgi:cyclopropane-fatty-acyl-phospholipid synthase
MQTALRLVERGLGPELLLRPGIRGQLRARLSEQQLVYGRDCAAALAVWIECMRDAEIAPLPHKANEQHYEVPPAFFALVLGRNLKYSSGLYAEPGATLDDAEEAMLELTAERAALEDGQEVLELGCGWGSLTLWMAEHFPRSRIAAVSNSAPQR